MPSLCCFWCPAPDKRVRKPGEKCPKCGRDYETPLISPPKQIGNYTITSTIARGFYSATYRALQQSLGRTVVLKVVPVGLYSTFNKDWALECQAHAEIAENTRSVAGIRDQFEARVAFGRDALDCYVAVLENIEGPTL